MKSHKIRLKNWLEDLNSATICFLLIILTLILFTINLLSVTIAANIILVLFFIFCVITLVCDMG